MYIWSTDYLREVGHLRDCRYVNHISTRWNKKPVIQLFLMQTRAIEWIWKEITKEVEL